MWYIACIGNDGADDREADRASESTYFQEPNNRPAAVSVL